jgi:rhodanese-related sulfurtransferase
MYATQTPFEVQQRLSNQENVTVIDVREDFEWSRGHIPQAKHIPLSELPERMMELNREQETILVCHSGNRSRKACDFLHEQGYRVVNMSGGMSNWFWEVQL